MPKIIQDPHVHALVNGVVFTPRAEGGSISAEDVTGELLEQFLVVPGFTVEAAPQAAAPAAPAPTPAPVAAPVQAPAVEAETIAAPAAEVAPAAPAVEADQPAAAPAPRAGGKRARAAEAAPAPAPAVEADVQPASGPVEDDTVF